MFSDKNILIVLVVLMLIATLFLSYNLLNTNKNVEVYNGAISNSDKVLDDYTNKNVLNQSENTTNAVRQTIDAGYGAEGALKQVSYSNEQMLIYAIQDEFLAKSEYEAIIDKFKVTTPFTNIIKSEQNHIEKLTNLFNTYNITIPANTSKDHLVIPATLQTAYETGVKAEINNIAMYEAFLKQNLPDDLRTVFNSLLSASQNHLNTFEKKANI